MRTIRARWFHEGRIEPVRVIVVHDMEAPESSQTAENCASYFATTTNQASAHVCVDSDSRVRCVPDEDTAWAAPGCNADGLQLEIAGYMRQTREQWLDPFSVAALDQAAQQSAEWCRKYGLPVRLLTRAELAAGRKGITQHLDVSAVYRRSDHTDPGSGFPWDVFLAMVQDRLGSEERVPVVQAVSKVPAFPGRLLRVTTPLMRGDDARRWQRRMSNRGWNLLADGVYGNESRKVATSFQAEKGLVADGIVGPETWRYAWESPIR